MQTVHQKGLTCLAFMAYLCAAFSAAGESGIQITARHGQSVRGTLHGMPVLVLRGSHRERGIDLGFLAAKDILDLLDRAFIPLLNIKLKDPQAWDKQAAIQTKFIWPERYKAELEGMLAGIREALPDPAQRNLASLSREITLGDLYFLNCIYDIKAYSCSSFSAWGPLTPDGETITGRNFDSPKLGKFDYSKAFFLVAAAPSEKGLKATLDIRTPGFLGANTVLNEDGVFASIHEANDLGGDRTEGWTPRILCFRNAIETARREQAVADMAAELRKSPVRVGSILMVSDPAPKAKADAAGVLEWDGGAQDRGVTVREASADAQDMLACANHFLKRPSKAAGADTCRRYQSYLDTLARFRSDGKKVDVDAAKKLLHGSECAGETFTVFSVVVQPKLRSMQIAMSPKTDVSASLGSWFEVKWDDVFQLK